MDELLKDLVQRLTAAFGDALVSAILYGSAAAGDYHEHHSDLNILCVLTGITPHELQQSEPVFRWWRENGNPPPLLLSQEEIRTSSDSFPMEFHDIQEQRRVLHGADLIRDLVIDESFYRAQIEHELRAKQIRLRQKAAEVLSSPDRLQRLMVDSVSTFCVLGRHALILSGQQPRWMKTEIVSELENVMRRPLSAIAEILALRSAPTRKAGANVPALFGNYLKEVDALVRFVDGIHSQK